MNIYPTYLTMHIVFAGIWLSFFIVEFILRGRINKGASVNENISNYLKFTNIFGNTGAIGILLTGIMLVTGSGYGFFDLTSNHWLAAKQIILVLILLIIVAIVMPLSGEIREELAKNEEAVSEKNIRKLFRANLANNILVLLNFLFAITHRFYG